jgi:hypothetical protein
VCFDDKLDTNPLKASVDEYADNPATFIEEFGVVFNRMITQRNPTGNQELEMLGLAPPGGGGDVGGRPTGSNGVESELQESSMGCEDDATDCDEGASGAPTNTWTRNGVVFTVGIYSVLAAINY